MARSSRWLGAPAPPSSPCSLLAPPHLGAPPPPILKKKKKKKKCRADVNPPPPPEYPAPQDPHPGNIFALRDGRIAYVDFGNVAELSQRNKEVLVDAVVHAVNEDYEGMAQVGAGCRGCRVQGV